MKRKGTMDAIFIVRQMQEKHLGIGVGSNQRHFLFVISSLIKNFKL